MRSRVICARAAVRRLDADAARPWWRRRSRSRLSHSSRHKIADTLKATMVMKSQMARLESFIARQPARPAARQGAGMTEYFSAQNLQKKRWCGFMRLKPPASKTNGHANWVE